MGAAVPSGDGRVPTWKIAVRRTAPTFKNVQTPGQAHACLNVRLSAHATGGALSVNDKERKNTVSKIGEISNPSFRMVDDAAFRQDFLKLFDAFV